MKQKRAIAGIAVILIAAIITVMILTWKKNDFTEDGFQRSLALGEQYLYDLDYEQAIAIYESILDIDAENMEAMISLSQAYKGLAENTSEEVESKTAYYETAIAYAESVWMLNGEIKWVEDNLREVYSEAGDFFRSVNDTERAAYYDKQAGELGSIKNTKNKSVDMNETEETKQNNEEIVSKKMDFAQENLKEILDVYQTGDYDRIKELTAQRNDKELLETLMEGESIYYGEYSSDGTRDGLGVAVYLIRGVPTAYAGEWKSGKREGEACWYGKIAYWKGTWNDDLPNGGMEAFSYDGSFHLSGKVIDGLWDGETVSTDLIENVEYVMTFEKGKVRILETIDWQDGDPYRYNVSVGIRPDGMESYFDYSDKEVNALHGVWGFADTETNLWKTD